MPSQALTVLFATPGNPVPEGANVGTVVTADGVAVRFAYWRPSAGRRLGTVTLLQGRAECIEKYFEVIGDLRRRGFAVATFDWRGQGGSERLLRNPLLGHVANFSGYDWDLDAVLREVVLLELPEPHFALAHSTGALVALRAAANGRVPFVRMVLTAPLLEIAPIRIPWWSAGLIISAAATAGLRRRAIFGARRFAEATGGFAGNVLTSDPERYARIIAIGNTVPALTTGVPTFGWVQAARSAMRQARRSAFGLAIGVPTLLIGSGADKVVSTAAITRFARNLRAGAHVIIAGARHEVMMERDLFREQFFAAFDAFVPGSRVAEEEEVTLPGA